MEYIFFCKVQLCILYTGTLFQSKGGWAGVRGTGIRGRGGGRGGGGRGRGRGGGVKGAGRGLRERG